MPSSVALWTGGYMAALEDDALGIEACLRRIDRNPLGSAAGYGTPGLAIDREATRVALGFAATEEPVTAVQLARGKGEAQLLFEIALLMGDLGRLGSELVLFASAEFGFVELPVEMTTGSSIMPRRNPDLFELVRACSSLGAGGGVADSDQAAERVSPRLQLLKAPLFRSLDLAHATCDCCLDLPRVRFGGAVLSPELHAAEAHRLVVEEGLPFREAYRIVALRYGRSGGVSPGVE
jgi:argininosuccinate lyase